jgi:hypothetical protein
METSAGELSHSGSSMPITKENFYESHGIGQKALRQLQTRPAQRCVVRNL